MAIALKKCGVIDAKTYYVYFAQAEQQDILHKEVHEETGEASRTKINSTINNNSRHGGNYLLGLQVFIFVYCIETRAFLSVIQVVVTDNHGAGVTPVQVFQQLSHRNLLLSRSRVSGLTADVQTTLVAYAYRVFVVVLAFYMAVGANHPFWSAALNLSVTTDDVVVSDAEFPASLAMP